MIPTVLLCYHSRPMSAGLFFRDGFRQAGCRVLVAGPSTPRVYGKPDGTEHEFPAEDFEAPTIELPNSGVDVRQVVEQAERMGHAIDLVTMVDQYDDFWLSGSAPPGTAFAYVCVENFGPLYVERLNASRPDKPYYMIAHAEAVPFPRADFSWLPFGFDPFIHPLLPTVARTKAAVQIGTAYEPRPTVWNYLRAKFDDAPPCSQGEYLSGLAESASTLFGRTPSYRDMAVACNQAFTALSSSNCDFSPMRTCEAYAMGSVLVSDDVPTIRAVLGPPLSEGGFWVAHDRTPEGHYRAVCQGVEAHSDIIDRGIAHVYRRHTYKHRAERILADLGIQGACRMIAGA